MTRLEEIKQRATNPDEWGDCWSYAAEDRAVLLQHIEKLEAALREVGELPDRWDAELRKLELRDGWLSEPDSSDEHAAELRAILDKHFQSADAKSSD